VVAVAAAPAMAPPGAHATTETVRHEAVDDRVGAALDVRQQVGRQLSTTSASSWQRALATSPALFLCRLI